MLISVSPPSNCVVSRQDSSSDQGSPIDLDEVLKPQTLEQKEKDAEADKSFKDTKKIIEVGSLWKKAEDERDQAEQEKLERSKGEYRRCRKETETMRREFEDRLTRDNIVDQQWDTIFAQARLSQRAQDFHRGLAAVRHWWYQRNFSHILAEHQVQWIIEELKKRWSLEEDQDYIYHVLLPQAILIIYAAFHNIPLEEANKRLMTTTGESDSDDSESPGGNVDDSAKPAAG